MTLEQTKGLLQEKGIRYVYFLRDGLYIVKILSDNVKKDLELCFLEDGADAMLESVAFGDYEWDYPMDAEELSRLLRTVTSGLLWVIHSTNAKTGIWIDTKIYNETQMAEFQKRVEELEKPPNPENAYQARRHSSMVHEVYNWKMFRLIKKQMIPAR